VFLHISFDLHTQVHGDYFCSASILGARPETAQALGPHKVHGKVDAVHHPRQSEHQGQRDHPHGLRRGRGKKRDTAFFGY
jgi:hypothetical protein